MNTPIDDFVKAYAEKNALRLHMPGHKGVGEQGEKFDLTEIDGADDLYRASGIILESEKNASAIFGCDTFYSTEGSSQCIRAMMKIALSRAKKRGIAPLVFAGRNAHKSFVSAAALCDLSVKWLYGESQKGILSCDITAEYLEKELLSAEVLPMAVYITSPDYLGNIADVFALSKVCDKYNVPLLVDNAHGAYLRFLAKDMHPISLGAAMCASSAHKTLPVLTGGAYLQISEKYKEEFSFAAKSALAFFGSTSPSYLTLASLDRLNFKLSRGYGKQIADFADKVKEVKEYLISNGFTLCGSEPLKITVCAKSYGYTGSEIARILEKSGVYVEFYDDDYLVVMFTPETGEDGLLKIKKELCAIPRRAAVSVKPPQVQKTVAVKTIREAAFAPYETVSYNKCVGRVLAEADIACPPAVPIVFCGELIDESAVKAFKYYGIKSCKVIKE